MNTSNHDVERNGASTETADAPEELLTANVSVVSIYEPDELVTDARTKLRGLVPGVVSLIVGITILILTTGVKRANNALLGPEFWPDMIGWGIVLLGLTLLITFFIRGLCWGDVPAPITGWGLSRLLATGAVLVGYLMLWGVLVFWASTLITTLLLLVLYGARGWKPLVFFPVGITALLHFLFVVALRVPL